ncbi:MAG: hypothetical protein KAQ69_00355 [Spirochaetales bacterium]|nr:hypothetical protein [Spirochaetales bacterium]
MKTDNYLIDSLLADAETEAAKLIADAEDQSKKRLEMVIIQEEKILEEAGIRAEARIETLDTSREFSLKVGKKQMLLKIQEKLFHAVMSELRDQFSKLIESDDYAEVVKGWIIEAAIGLDSAAIEVNASQYERKLIDKPMLDAAVAKVHDFEGRDVKITLAKGTPLSEPGIVCRDRSGRLQFDNRIESRIKRYESYIRKIIAGKLLNPGLHPEQIVNEV